MTLIRLHYLVVILLLSSCATSGQKDSALKETQATDQNASPQTTLATAPVVSSSADLNDNETDMQKLPADMNEKVTMWIEYFQGRGREHMSRYLSRSSRYLPKMKEILKSHGLPEDLVYIALIESGFSSQAHSRASAVGYWQFIGGTGRRYGLQQNYYIDDRRDFIASTEAASQYLKALYNLFGSWYLAIASYNVGENRIKNLVMKYYTRDFWELARKDRLPGETINYVPKFLAARLIAKHPEKYGFDDVVYEPPLDFKEISLNSQGLDLRVMAKHLGLSSQELMGLNPAYKQGIIPKRNSGVAKLRVPTHVDDQMILAALPKSDSKVSINVIAKGDGENYRIRRGDTLSHIAQKFGTSIQAIREANNLNRGSMLYPGKSLIVPIGRSVSTAPATKPAEAVSLLPGERQYVVQEGDNLYTIAKRFGVSLSKIKERNKLARGRLIKIGHILVIPNLGGNG